MKCSDALITSTLCKVLFLFKKLRKNSKILAFLKIGYFLLGQKSVVLGLYCRIVLGLYCTIELYLYSTIVFGLYYSVL